VGTPVFGGMIAASVFGIFVIPLLYIVAESLRQLTRSRGTKVIAAPYAGATIRFSDLSSYMRQLQKNGNAIVRREAFLSGSSAISLELNDITRAS
jgi:hypothetical protein